MKFLHCADIHLDSPMRGLPRLESTPADRLRGATRDALERLVDLAIAEAVAFVVIAGDLYDGDRDDYNTAIYLQRQLRRLSEAGVPVAIALGNHDSANEITKRLRLPDNCHLFPHEAAGSLELAGCGAVLHGQSYPTRDVTADLSASYPRPVSGALNVGVLHTALDGREGHASYAPCTPAALSARGYQYWALGHVHGAERIDREGVPLVFPGNLQGRHAREAGPKGAVIVEYDGDRVLAVEQRELAPVRFEVMELDLRSAASADEALGRAVEAAVGAPRSPATDLVAVRLVLSLARTVGESWLRDRERIEAQLRADVDGDTVWLEHVRAERAGEESDELVDGAANEVRAAIAELRSAAAPPVVFETVVGPVRSRLGAEFELLCDLEPVFLGDRARATLLEGVEALLLAELRGAR